MAEGRTDFSIKSRQSQWAIIFIVIKHLRRLLAQFWPLAAAYFLGRRSSSSYDRYEIIFSAVGSLGMIWGIALFYRYYYYIQGEELIIEKGIFKKVRLNLPFERIQSVNFSQNVLHQALGVTAVDIESAGSDQKELQIDALDLKVAEELRAILLARKAQSANSKVGAETNAAQVEEPAQEILRLGTRDLIRVGLTQNHFRPVRLVFGLFATLWFYAYSFDFDPWRYAESLYTSIDIDNSITAGIILAIVILSLMVLYSIVTTWMRHHDLRFWRSGERFQVVQGLFNRRQFSALDSKIQIISWHQNPLQKLLNFHKIHFSQARSNDMDWGNTDFSIPGCQDQQVNGVLHSWLDRDSIDKDQAQGVTRHYFWHRLRYIVLVAALLLGVFVYLEKWKAILPIIILATVLSALRYRAFTKKKYAIDHQDLYIGGGVLGAKNSLIPLHKIQNLSIQQNPYQVRRDIASLHVHTAAGSLIIPYIPTNRAKDLMDQMLYRVETSRESWM